MSEILQILPPAIECRNVDISYAGSLAVRSVQMEIPTQGVTAFIGPSGCGKSTLLRAVNRMNDFLHGARITQGQLLVDGHDIHGEAVDPVELRRRVGMVFQKSNPFPRSVYENIAYGPRVIGERRREVLDVTVETALRDAALWDEVKDRLHESAYGLSVGQQQRLCIARAIAMKPSILLMDEPCSALDPLASSRIEDLIHQLREHYTIVIVTHNMQQATRVSDWTAFFHLGELVEFDLTSKIFANPSQKRTEDYITGRFG